MFRIAPLSEADPARIEALLDAAFGSDRRARTAYRLRAGTLPVAQLSIAAFEGEALAGTLQCWPIELAADDGAVRPLLLVGPVAVRPDLQGAGIGRAMMAEMLARADAQGAPPQLLIGDLSYYGRFGFDASTTAGWRLPGPWEPHRLLARGAAGLPRDGEVRARVAVRA